MIDLSTLSWWALEALRKAAWTTDERRAETERLMPAAYVRDDVANQGRNDQERAATKHRKRRAKG